LKEHFNILKTTSGSSPGTDLSSNITFSQSISHATVPLSAIATRRLTANRGGQIYLIYRKVLVFTKSNFYEALSVRLLYIYTVYTVGATRLARATALARSLSNTNMEMFYKDFRLEISTD
jgi:hypothetical protein